MRRLVRQRRRGAGAIRHAAVPHRSAASGFVDWITAEGRVTAYTGKCDSGKASSLRSAAVAESSRPAQSSHGHSVRYGGHTRSGNYVGHQSTPTNFNRPQPRAARGDCAGCVARPGIDLLGVAATSSRLRGFISPDKRPSRRSLRRAHRGKKFNLQVDARARRKPASEWKVLGTSASRVDMVSMATGEFEFVHNVRVPGMLHGAVVRPPEVGSTVMSVDEGSVRGLPGDVRVVTKKNFVGVVAQKPWQARQAATRLKVTWSEGRGLPAQREHYETLRKQPSRDTLLLDSKDVGDRLAKAAAVVKATYLHPCQMHGSIGASCAGRRRQGSKATVWSPTQSLPDAQRVAMLLGLGADDVRVIFTRGAGCYGSTAPTRCRTMRRCCRRRWGARAGSTLAPG